jgi:Fe2+ or Zn2+ uptake regulation protein
MRPVEEICDALRASGMKVTPQRRMIFEILQHSDEHPTAEEIHDTARETMPDMSLATVYHTLNDLVRMGELVELDLGEGKSRYDPTTDEHYHLVCLGCRQVVDVPRTGDPLQILPIESRGYEIERCEVVFYGYCLDCQE